MWISPMEQDTHLFYANEEVGTHKNLGFRDRFVSAPYDFNKETSLSSLVRHCPVKRAWYSDRDLTSRLRGHTTPQLVTESLTSRRKSSDQEYF
ncbi:PREDICTED: uncharacterized protein LOC109475601 isoform X2 [Branchiostoma belcheri]|uniref:Uncharacterized protein LOC109475601 isoform X2 n=1 Tax=Branchiostoma belcheri TaxID=7741 RepID=A0A6P4ZLE4_BRABE|nr:PREDICTED: uncharacterized protein LOC109475601 isoform X2 [Branchiostoma belcheri]